MPVQQSHSGKWRLLVCIWVNLDRNIHTASLDSLRLNKTTLKNPTFHSSSSLCQSKKPLACHINSDQEGKSPIERKEQLLLPLSA
jgi:hypothetical protein